MDIINKDYSATVTIFFKSHMPALNSLIQQQHHQIPILVSSIMFITCYLFITVTLVTLPCHHITMSPSPPLMTTSTMNTTTSMITMTEGREDENNYEIHGSAGDGDKHWPPPSPLANNCDHHHTTTTTTNNNNMIGIWEEWGVRCVHVSNPGFFLPHNNNHEW